jgi:pimeloyl-ACP methyl ester carboxylesterase
MKEHKYQHNNITLNYAEGPNNGPPILLVHGNMGRWQSFTSIIPDLILNMHVFALDLRGHGKSSHAPGTYTLQNHLADVSSFIKNKIGSPVVIFGMSLGGMISLMAAAKYPEMIHGIIIADSPLTLETLEPILKSQKELGYRIINYIKTNQIDKLYNEINDDFSAESFCLCDIDIIDMTFDRYETMLEGFDVAKLLPLIKSPVLIMRGEQSLGSMVSDNDMRIAASLCPQLIQQKINGVGHSLLESKEIVLETISNFLESLPHAQK